MTCPASRIAHVKGNGCIGVHLFVNAGTVLIVDVTLLIFVGTFEKWLSGQ